MIPAEQSLYTFSEDELPGLAAANDPALGLAAEGGELRVTFGRQAEKGEGPVRTLRLPNPAGRDWTGAGALCFAVENPYDELFAIDLEIFDGNSEGFHRGYYEIRWVLVPGRTDFVVDLGESFRHGEHKEDPMDRGDIRALQLAVRGGVEGEREVRLSGLRLVPAADEGSALAANARAVAAFWAGRRAAPERAAAKAAAAELAAVIEEAKGKGLDTIYAEATHFVAQLGLEIRAELAWFSSVEQQRALHTWVKGACARTTEELRAALAGRRQLRTLTRHAPPELTLKGAYWYAGDEPVLVTAMLYNSEGPLMRFFHPADVLPCLLTTAGASRYDVETTPLYEAFQRYPETHRVGYHDWCGHLIRDRWSMGGRNEEVVICLESPYMKHAMAQAIRAKTPYPWERPNMLVHVMEGELSYCCYCEHTQEMFRKWLLERHGSVEAVNAVWGTDYAEIAEIRTPHHEQWDGNRARWFDFVDFNQRRFTAHHAWAKARVREKDPFTPTTVGGIYYVFSPRQGLLGVDNEAWVDEVCEAAEAEAGSEGAMPTDFLWAVGDGRVPIVDLEYHSDIFGWWEHFLHGYAALAMWFWPTRVRGDFVETSVPHSPLIPLSEVEKLLVNALDLQRLGRYVIPFPAARSPFALLYSRSSLLQAPPHVGRSNAHSAEMYHLYRATRSLDAGRTFVTERDLAQGQARRFRIIALPSVTHLAPESFAFLKSYVEAGGTLLLLGDSLRADQYARPADYLAQLGLSVSGDITSAEGDEAPERQPFGPDDPGWSAAQDPAAYHFSPEGARLLGQAPRLQLRAEGAEVLARFEDGAPGLLRLARGAGQVYCLAARLGEESLATLVERLLSEAGVAPLVSLRNAQGQPLRDLEARAVEHEGAVLLYAINSRSEPLTVTLHSARPFTEVEDLRTLERRPYDGLLTLPARDTGLYRLT